VYKGSLVSELAFVPVRQDPLFWLRDNRYNNRYRLVLSFFVAFLQETNVRRMYSMGTFKNDTRRALLKNIFFFI
jgi:hypothetical protein